MWRIRDRDTFQRLRRSRTRARAGTVVVTRAPLAPSAAAGSGPARPAVAFAVSRKVGTAVVRNRLRRQLRATLRDLDLPPAAYLVSVAQGAGEVAADQVRADLIAAVDALPSPSRPAGEETR